MYVRSFVMIAYQALVLVDGWMMGDVLLIEKLLLL